MDSETSEAADDLNGLIAEAERVVATRRFSAEHSRWIMGVRFALGRYFGTRSDLFRGFAELDWQIPAGTIIQSFDLRSSIQEDAHMAFLSEMDTARGLLQAGVDQLNRVGLAGVRAAAGLASSTGNKNVFVTHGGNPPILAKVERVVRVLGFNPIVVEREPSGGKAADDLVPDQMRNCICSIVVATPDHENPDSGYPRPNVLHEIGLAQEIFSDKVVYLKQTGLNFPSNVSPKIWESFDDDDAEQVWDKIVREFRGFGFIP